MGIHDDARLIMKALKRAHHALHSRSAKEWSPQLLTPTQFQALLHLHWSSSADGLTIGEIVEQLGLAYSTVSNLVDRLEEHGWVERHRNPSDQRRIHILLTEKARSLFEQNREQTERFVSETIGRLSGEERQTLIDSLNRLITVMKSTAMNSPECRKPLPKADDSEQRRFRRAVDGWIEAKISMIGRASVLAAFAEEEHEYEIAGYLKQMAHDLIEQTRSLWIYVQDPPDISAMLRDLKTQQTMSRDAALEAWRFADSLDDERFSSLIASARRDARKHKQWFRQMLERFTERSRT